MIGVKEPQAKYTSLFELMSSKQNKNIVDYVTNSSELTYYDYKGTMVPRVSLILDKAIGNKGLVDWAGRVGYNKMVNIRESSLAIGSIVHEMIEYNLKYDQDKEVNFSDYNLSPQDMEAVDCAYTNYKLWKRNLYSTGHAINEIVAVELPVSCPWYGGTIDCIMRINNGLYLVDFKTSKSISQNYLYQICSYAWLVNCGYTHIKEYLTGLGILRFDKTCKGVYEEYFLSFYDPAQTNIIYQYTKTFWAIVYSFYNMEYSSSLLEDTLKKEEYNIS